MPPGRPHLSIVIPAFNEAACIATTLDQIRRFLIRDHPAHEVLVVDDGSTDETPMQVQHMARHWQGLRLLRLSVNRGKGYAVRTGALSARGDWILCTDADLSTPIEDLDRLLARTETNQVVIGSRSIPGARIAKRQRLLRSLLGQTFNRLTRLLVQGSFADTQCGFKLFGREAAQDIFSRQVIDGFAFDVEVLFLAHRLGYRIAEQPVAWLNDEASRVRLWRDPARMFLDLARIRWHHRDL